MVRVLSFDVGCINFAYCLMETTPTPRVLECGKKRLGDARTPIDRLIGEMHRYLSATPATAPPAQWDAVLIEQQVGRSSPKNYGLGAALYMYYVGFTGVDLQFVCPRTKFTKLARCDDVPGIVEMRGELRAARGKALKALSIKCTRILAAHWGCDVLEEKLRTVIKKDDIADSFLYCATYSM